MISGSLSSIILIVSSAATGGVLYAPEVLVRGDIVYLGDVADLGAVPAELRDKAGRLALSRLPENLEPVVFRKAEIDARVRSLMPALAPWFGEADGTVSVIRRKDDPMRAIAAATQQDGIAKGDRVSITIVAGVYTIERQATAMSAAKIGEKLFVKTEDRKAISVLCCGK